MKTLADPRNLHPVPPFPIRPQTPPGRETRMRPIADHGENSYKGNGRLRGRRALVTGGDSGIGRAVAIAFAREGAHVAISYLDELDDAKDTERLVVDCGVRCLILPGDISRREHCVNLINSTLAEFGGIDLLVNNAGYQRTYRNFEDIPTDEFERAFQVNVFAMFYLCQAALPHMPAGSSIINLASIQSFDPSEKLLPYAATKAAIASFTNSLAALAIQKGVRVNAVAPGPVWTPLIPSTMDEAKVRHFGENTAFGRPAQPAEIAPIFVFLASAEASFVTGEVYGVTGGRTPL
jgi:NAD(P)-dependent dehydrogenase (short-subunit alcohol dehydrogenase family)